MPRVHQDRGRSRPSQRPRTWSPGTFCIRQLRQHRRETNQIASTVMKAGATQLMMNLKICGICRSAPLVQLFPHVVDPEGEPHDPDLDEGEDEEPVGPRHAVPLGEEAVGVPPDVGEAEHQRHRAEADGDPLRRVRPNSSCTKAMAGEASATEEVMPAMKRRKYHMKARTCPRSCGPGRFESTAPIAMMPKSKEPCEAIAIAPVTPKKVTAAGTAIVPPSTTSANSFVEAVARPVSVTSSSSER